MQNNRNANLTNSDSAQYQARWQRPTTRRIKCNYDGSFHNSTTKASSAWILRDSDGVFKGAGQASGNIVTSALEAECQSLIIAMQQSWIKGYRHVVFEGDCKILVEILHGRRFRFDILNWIHEIRDWEKKFLEIEHNWVPRQINKAADCLVKAYHHEMPTSVFYPYIPYCITECLHYDFVSSS